MYIVKGTYRIAFIGKRYAFKVPKVTPRMMAQDVYDSFAGSWHSLSHSSLKDIFAGRTNVPPRSESFAGIRANLLERRFSARLGDIVVPTKFSLFGLINVMDYASSLLVPDNILAEKHPFAPLKGSPINSADNFGYHKGKMKLLNYGGMGLITYLLENRQLFRKQLDALEHDLGYSYFLPQYDR